MARHTSRIKLTPRDEKKIGKRKKKKVNGDTRRDTKDSHRCISVMFCPFAINQSILVEWLSVVNDEAFLRN